ncbi:MAG: hypothetical protein GF334_04115 [Candidatus Altiarchaeales archaeon]|nr:hypothetical protein [Candidatus Altiarchaeales archaeon]
MKGLCLLSSGIDSPVAAYLLHENNLALEFIHMFVDESSCEIASSLRDLIDGGIPLHVVSVLDMHEAITGNTQNRFHCVLCKRMFYRLACRLAFGVDAQVLVTGESIGQVASQTLDNLCVLDDASDLPVLRPLIGMDKNEIIDVSRAAGLYEASIADQSPCPFVPRKPATQARLNHIRKQEDKLDVEKIVEDCLFSRREI